MKRCVPLEAAAEAVCNQSSVPVCNVIFYIHGAGWVLTHSKKLDNIQKDGLALHRTVFCLNDTL
ncbi:MAG: hypothetical protein J1E56_02340 [Ruminococcus sp.]|nr:hypothetical protein [Ruminococcus sp.]